MTELELYKFINDNNVEYHCNNENEIFAFVHILDIKDFNELLGESIMDEEGIMCTMKYGYFCFEMVEICEYFGIEPKNIFINED